MALEIRKGNEPTPKFRSNKYPELIEALDDMVQGESIDFDLSENDSEATIRNMIYRYTKIKWTEHRAKIVVRNDTEATRVYVKKVPRNEGGSK